MSKRMIEIENNATLEFAFRENAEQLKENAKQVKVLVDLSKLSPEDIMEWAYSAMVVSYQSKLRSKNPPVLGEVVTKNADGTETKTPKDAYEWVVPSRGTRSTTDPKKVEEAASKLLSKMDESGKKELLYKTLISMGKTSAEAVAISGYVEPKVEAPAPTKNK